MWGDLTTLWVIRSCDYTAASSPAQTGLFPGGKEVGDHVSEDGPRGTEIDSMLLVDS